MKRIIQFLILAILTLSGTGCATRGFVSHRLHDAGDIFTVTGGVGAGAKARVGPVGTGLFVGADKVGVRAGNVITLSKVDRSVRKRKKEISRVREVTFPVPFLWGNDSGFYIVTVQDEYHLVGSDKPHTAYSFLPLVSWVATPRRGGPDETRARRRRALLRYNSEVEVALGLGFTGRLGINGAEILDFILGWTGLDILQDDGSTRKNAENRTSH